MNNELITLITVLETTEDTSGFKMNEETVETEIFADIKSVGRMEYYEALRNGINVSIVFEINPDDFELADRFVEVEGKAKKVRASKVFYSDVMYRIVRSYKNKDGILELTCAEVE